MNSFVFHGEVKQGRLKFDHPDKLAQEFNLHPDDFNVLWDKLLFYVSGWRRKRVTFKRWLKMLEADRVRRMISNQSI